MKMYTKEKKKATEEKAYVVTRNFQSGKPGGKTPRNVKMVDRRMKKDQRNAKFKVSKRK